MEKLRSYSHAIATLLEAAAFALIIGLTVNAAACFWLVIANLFAGGAQ